MTRAFFYKFPDDENNTDHKPKKNWTYYFCEAEVVQKKIQSSHWILKDGTLYVACASPMRSSGE